MAIKKCMLFFTPMCPKCPSVKEYLKEKDIEKEMVNAASPDGLDKARDFQVGNVPTVVFLDEDDKEVTRAYGLEEAKKVLENKQLG